MEEFTKKHRPKTLDEVFGNNNIKDTLKTLINNKEVPHALLFIGDSGTGKTTLARIIASTFGNPNIQEIDCTLNGGVNDIRTLTSNASFKLPLNNKKVFIFDEAHKISTDGQNALLKPMEESPEHVYYILCTDNPGKIINAIKTRCVQFIFRTLNILEANFLIDYIINSENITLTKEVRKNIIEVSQGVARNIVKNLGVFYNTGNITTPETETVVKLNTLIRALSSKNWNKIINAYKGIDKTAEEIRFSLVKYAETVLFSNEEELYFKILKYFLCELCASNQEAHMLLLMHNFIKEV